MKGTVILKRLFLAVMLLCLLTGNTVYAASKPSQAGEKVLSGGQRDFKWPVPGTYNLSSCFLDYRRHYAIDIAASKGTSVVASYAGTVVKTYSGCTHNYEKNYNCCDSGFGNYVIVKHSYTLKSGESITLYTQYSHLTAVSVSKGQWIGKGGKVGTVGSTGYSTGPHLDFQILTSGYGPNYTGFRNYSIDPYVNELLELPEALHTTFGGCCRSYVAYVKDLYPRCTHESFNAQGKCTGCGYNYDWKSTADSSAMGNYTVASDISVKALPYYAAEGIGQTLRTGTTVCVSAGYTNGAAERWYAVTEDGRTLGYVPKSALRFTSYLESLYDGKLSSPTQGQTLSPQPYTLKGSVSSRYPLRKVYGYLDDTRYATWSSNGNTTKLDLTGTDINNKLYFSSLAPGKHTLRITATDATGRGETTVATCTFYMQAPTPYYTVVFDSGKSGISIKSTEVQEGKTLQALPAPEWDGYEFLGWFTAVEGGTQMSKDTPITQALTLYARWMPLQHTVSFGDTQLTVARGQTIDELPTLLKDGFRFVGWFTAPEGGIPITEETVITQNWQLYPRWEPMTYTVTLDCPEGSLLFAQKPVTYGAPYGALPSPHREGYVFCGWQLKESQITADTAVSATADHTLTATWSAATATRLVPRSETAWKIVTLVLFLLCAGGLVWVLFIEKSKPTQDDAPFSADASDCVAPEDATPPPAEEAQTQEPEPQATPAE